MRKYLPLMMLSCRAQIFYPIGILSLPSEGKNPSEIFRI